MGDGGTLAPPVARRLRAHPVLLAVVIVGLLGSGLWAVTGHDADGSAAPDPATSAVVAELEAFVESARGLPFLEPVDVRVVGDSAFRRALAGGDSTSAADAEIEAGVLRALGLIEPGDDVRQADVLDADTVDGFYDTDTKELYVRGGKLTPFVRQVLVHELTHALDDQHFDLDPDLADDEASLAFDALVEGDAVVIENRYVDSLSPAERREAAAEEDAAFGSAGSQPDNTPEVFLELGDFPYVDGPEMVAALVDAGGQARVDAAFRSPPSTSAEVLHPRRYLGGRGRADVPPVASDGRVVDDGVLGELVLRLVLAESTTDEQAARAAEGWAGDEYVAWRTGKRMCVRATVVLDDAAEAAEFGAGLRVWAGEHPGASVIPGAHSVTFSRCA
jgi:hypothetical protein